MELANKGVLVSGGASGLGAACARLLSQCGAKVVIADMNSETGNALAKELGDSTLFVQTNVVEEGSVQAVGNSFRRLHVDLNFSGIGGGGRGVGKGGTGRPGSLPE